MKKMYKVWDKINDEENHAFDIEAYSVREAAELYADEDWDGLVDGIYEQGQPIMVKDGKDLYEVEVQVEYEPRFYGRIKK